MRYIVRSKKNHWKKQKLNQNKAHTKLKSLKKSKESSLKNKKHSISIKERERERHREPLT